MAETTLLSPEAVESLAVSLAAKLAYDRKGFTDLSDQMVEFHTTDRIFKEEDKAFKKNVSDSLIGLQRQRVIMPAIAVGAAIISIILSVVGLAGTAQAVSKLSDQLNAQQQELYSQEKLIHRFHPEEK